MLVNIVETCFNKGKNTPPYHKFFHVIRVEVNIYINKIKANIINFKILLRAEISKLC